jgi:hypothetical protein
VSRAEAKARGAYRLTANAAQLSLRDLRLRPLRPLPHPPDVAPFESPLERALTEYLESLP